MLEKKKVIKNSQLGSDRSEQDDYTNAAQRNLLLKAMSNPDLLSDEQALFQSEDADARENRDRLAKAIRKMLDRLTPREKEAIQYAGHNTFETGAEKMGINKTSFQNLVERGRKKIMKFVVQDPDLRALYEETLR